MAKKRNNPQKGSSTEVLPLLSLNPNELLDISTLKIWLWDAACTIRRAADAQKFKDFILPLVFYKRLSDVFDDEFEKHIQEFGSTDAARLFREF